MRPESKPLALQGLTDAALCAAVPGLAPAQARAVLAAVHRDRPLSPRPGLPRAALEAVLARGAAPELAIAEERASSVDPFRKLVLTTGDGRAVECVAIPLERPGRVSVCVSSQVGCALACAFCATGRLGLARNLEPWEMVEQVRAVRRRLPAGARVHGVVFQGMGEPLANLDRVAAAIAVLTAPYAGAIDARAITVSTAGLPDGIRRLARLAPRVRLALSIGSARPEVRERLMPIARAHPLDQVIDAAVDHARATGLAPMWAVTLLAGVNDAAEDARALAELAARFAARAGVRPRVSVLDYNPIGHAGEDPFRRSSPAAAAAFRDALAAAGLRSHRRYSGGADIAAACGQLAARLG
ncbi:MAG TPA: radical SAM protein [Kofleriaceae bacterium]|nr:radical SAM protein [Kofleriaceae bacterium]